MTLSPQGTAAIKQAVQQHIARNNARRTEREIQRHFGGNVALLAVRRNSKVTA